MKQTKIDELDAKEVEAARAAKRHPVKPQTSMADIEKAHGVTPVDPVAVARKAAKARIDSAAYGVEDNTPKPEAPEKKPRKPAAE